MLEKYRVSLSTIYGVITVDEVEAHSEKEAEEKAEQMIISEIENFSKVDEIHKY